LVKLDKIYTKGGDKGLTSLGDGKRVSKNSLRVQSYGEVDEVNATIGVVVCYCSDQLKKNLKNIQNHLFDIGADLCIPDKNKKAKSLNEGINMLEKEIDKMNTK